MPRPRSKKVSELKAKLLTRIREGFFRPGDRFLSNRALAERFGVSYQTAHRLVGELCEEGWMERRPASGTYIAGKRTSLTGVQFLVHERAQRAGSFGARLLEQLCARLEREKIDCVISFAKTKAALKLGLFPIIWECEKAVLPHLSTGCYALLLNGPAPTGVAGTFVDTVETDDFSGGVCAAEIFKTRGHRQTVVLAGPRDDQRSVRRVEGFLSLYQKTRVVWAEGWFFEEGFQAASRLQLEKKAPAVFCCNDRLAEGVIRYCESNRLPPPEVIGFDDAPIAETLNISTISIPWNEMIEAALGIIRKRLRGDSSTASRQILAPRPVIRHRYQEMHGWQTSSPEASPSPRR